MEKAHSSILRFPPFDNPAWKIKVNPQLRNGTICCGKVKKMKAKRFLVFLAAIMIVALLATAALQAKEKERSEIAEQYKWKITDLYPSLEAFQQAKSGVQADFPKLTAFKGRLGESAATLKAGLDLYYNLEMRMRRLEDYASRIVDTDARISENKAYQSEIQTLRAAFKSEAAFVQPEIIALGADRLAEMFKAEPGLAGYRFPIAETLRRQKHILSPQEEKILGAVATFSEDGYSTFNVFSNADMPLPDITLADGSVVTLTYPNFDKVRRSPVAADRVKAVETFFAQHDKFKRTFAQLLFTQIKTYTFFAQMRGYDSNLAAALDRDGVDTRIYYSLIEAAHRHLPTFHRYLKLKARALGKDHLEYTDMYVPFTAAADIPVSWEQVQSMLFEALRPLGEEYVEVLRAAFRDRWIDVYPNVGKETGAYSSGWTYEVHPYVLMNWTDTYGDALTMAHELGHALHSYNSNKTQPFPTADYSTFMAEVASTLNENLLNDYMLKNVKTDEERMYLLGNFLDNSIKGTLFRQTQFAEFELLMHERVAKGEALTDEVLNKIYLELARTYYGHDQGLVNVPDYLAVEWALIPHFYYNFYVFQYSTSLAAASLISQKIIDGEPGALEAYYTNLLRAGGSENPVVLLQRAGADMTNPAAYDALMVRANRYMDEIEKILDKKEGK